MTLSSVPMNSEPLVLGTVIRTLYMYVFNSMTLYGVFITCRA